MGEDPRTVGREVDAQRLDADLAQQLLRQAVTQRDVLHGEIRGVDQVTVGDLRRSGGRRARHVGPLPRGGPRAQGVAVVGLPDERRLHQGVVDRVVDLAAERIGEQQPQVEAAEFQRRGDRTVDVGNTAALQVFAAGGHRGVVGHVLRTGLHAAVGVLLIGPVELLAGGRIDARALGHVEGVDLLPLADDVDAVDDVLAVAGELQNLVFQRGTHHRDVPAPVARRDDVGAQRDVETAVDDAAHIGVIAREAERNSHRVLQQQVGGLAVIPLDGARKAVEQAEFDADVQVAVLLPRHVPVLDRVDHRTRLVGVRIVHVVERLPGVVGAEVVVALHAVAGFERDVVDPAHVAQEFLLRDTPRSPHRPEGSPAVLLLETRRGVHAEARREIVTVGEVVVDAAQIGVDRIVVGRRIGLGERRTHAQIVIVGEGEARALGDDIAHVVVVELVARHDFRRFVRQALPVKNLVPLGLNYLYLVYLLAAS